MASCHYSRLGKGVLFLQAEVIPTCRELGIGIVAYRLADWISMPLIVTDKSYRLWPHISYLIAVRLAEASWQESTRAPQTSRNTTSAQASPASREKHLRRCWQLTEPGLASISEVPMASCHWQLTFVVACRIWQWLKRWRSWQPRRARRHRRWRWPGSTAKVLTSSQFQVGCCRVCLP